MSVFRRVVVASPLGFGVVSDDAGPLVTIFVGVAIRVAKQQGRRVFTTDRRRIVTRNLRPSLLDDFALGSPHVSLSQCLVFSAQVVHYAAQYRNLGRICVEFPTARCGM